MLFLCAGAVAGAQTLVKVSSKDSARWWAEYRRVMKANRAYWAQFFAALRAVKHATKEQQ